MPTYEYLVAVTPPGSRKKLYYRGDLYINTVSEPDAVEQAIKMVQRTHGYNVGQEYSCVVNRLEEEEI